MKTFATLTVMLLFTLLAQGQDRKPETRVETITRELVPVSRILQKKDQKTAQVARLYRRPYARIKKELAFSTRESRPKVA